MATFIEMIKHKAVQPTFLKKESLVAELERQLNAIKTLNTEVPNARSFNRPSTTEANKNGKGQNLYLTKAYMV